MEEEGLGVTAYFYEDFGASLMMYGGKRLVGDEYEARETCGGSWIVHSRSKLDRWRRQFLVIRPEFSVFTVRSW